MDWCAKSCDGVAGDISVPGDKSISHRAVMLGALADGLTEVENFLTGADCQATATAMRAMGVRIDDVEAGRLRIYGVGLHGLRAPDAAIDLGNSGTSMRLLSGILAGQSFDVELHGDESLNRRPMGRVADPLTAMGARIELRGGATPPMRIRGRCPLQAIEYTLPMASAQVKSAVLLAGLYASGCTTVVEPAATRDHTERMLRGMGVEVDARDGRVSLAGGSVLSGTRIDVPGDISSAAFFLAAAALHPGSEVRLNGVGINPTRDGVITALRRMGTEIDVVNARVAAGEPLADLVVRGRPLRGIEIGADIVDLAIDELPAIIAAAACAEGETVIRDAAELRVKESDRVAAMVDGMTALGIDCEARPDGLSLRGGPMHGGVVESRGDHRIAMAFAIAASRCSGELLIRDCDNVATSFPGFVQLANRLGLELAVAS